MTNNDEFEGCPCCVSNWGDDDAETEEVLPVYGPKTAVQAMLHDMLLRFVQPSFRYAEFAQGAELLKEGLLE